MRIFIARGAKLANAMVGFSGESWARTTRTSQGTATMSRTIDDVAFCIPVQPPRLFENPGYAIRIFEYPRVYVPLVQWLTPADPRSFGVWGYHMRSPIHFLPTPTFRMQ
jgi:hypothetical protein